MATKTPQLSVAVIGAGLTGLLIAHGLQKVRTRNQLEKIHMF